MGIAERKEREKTERRQAILDAAQHLFLEEGFEKVSMRNIAEAIEYSPATIYLYFKDKNELLFALQNQAFGQLAQAFESVFTVAQPLERLSAVGHKYLEFAFEHPELFELMFIMTGPMEAVAARGEEKPWASGRAAFQPRGGGDAVRHGCGRVPLPRRRDGGPDDLESGARPGHAVSAPAADDFSRRAPRQPHDRRHEPVHENAAVRSLTFFYPYYEHCAVIYRW